MPSAHELAETIRVCILTVSPARRYLQALLDYLKSFYKRAFPLKDLDKDMEAAIRDFNQSWERGTVLGWSKDQQQVNGAPAESSGIWCEACQRSYAKQTVYDAHLTSKNHVKKAAALKNGNGAHQQQQGNGPASTSGAASSTAGERQRAMALLEHQIKHLVSDYDSPLLVIRNDTKANVERKQALTDKERQLENEELEERERREAEEAAAKAERAAKRPLGGGGGNNDDENDDEDDEERIYNPLKLPLGWDGKPIPFWLYKLHGLGVEYECEICSNFAYRGRKNFERHFQEARHAFGMRALGLPNTKHFHEITKIADAIALAEKLKQEGRQDIVALETMEEIEDDEGNVYNRKTYEDLKRQGLI